VFVEIIAEPDTALNAGDPCAEVESVKAAAEVYSPVSGTIVELNEDLLDAPELVNTDPYGEAWMVKIEISDASQVEALLDASAYQKHCEERSA
jgi:glycine cleavage system H protein